MHRRTHSPSRTRSKSADPGNGNSIESHQLFYFYFHRRRTSFFWNSTNTYQRFCMQFLFLNLPFIIYRMFDCDSCPFFLKFKSKVKLFCFIHLGRTSKRSRILDFFRGRGRASNRTDNHPKDRDHSQVILIDKTSMK